LSPEKTTKKKKRERNRTIVNQAKFQVTGPRRFDDACYGFHAKDCVGKLALLEVRNGILTLCKYPTCMLETEKGCMGRILELLTVRLRPKPELAPAGGLSSDALLPPPHNT
jgi:hypothetical protein